MTAAVEKKGLIDYFIRLTEFMMAITIIFDCNSVYRTMRFGVSPVLLSMIGINIFAAILIGLWVIKDRGNIECIKEHKLLFLVSFVFVFLFYFVNASKTETLGWLEYFLFFMNLMVILFRIYRRNHDTFRILFVIERVMIVISVVSVILWIGSNLLELWGMNEDVFVQWGGKYYNTNYLNMCLRRWDPMYVCDIEKNLGIFCEPPMFGLMLGFSIYTELFLKKKTNILTVLVFLIALLSSRAILGIMICAVAFFLKLVEMMQGKKYAKYVICGAVLAAAAVIVGLAMFKMGNESGSFRTHIDDFVAAFKCWTNYPIFGCGYGNQDPITEYMSAFRADNLGVSNSIAVTLAEGGIVLWLYYVIPFVIMGMSFFKKNKKTAYWAAGMFLFWVGVVFHLRLLIFLILALGYSMIDLKLTEDGNGKKKIAFAIKWFDENENTEPGFFVKKPLCVPISFRIVMMAFLVCVSGYCLINASSMQVTDIISAVVVLTGCVVLVLCNTGGRKMNGYINFAIECGLWLVFMLIGNLYQVLDRLYSATGLYIQDNWWTSIVQVILMYAVGCAIEMIRENKKVSVD